MAEIKRVVALKLHEITHETWIPFGTVPSDEQTEHDTADLEFLWNDGHVNFISHSNDELEFNETGAARCVLLNRHDTHTQTLMPMTGAGYVVVAPATIDFSDPQHFDFVTAFRLDQYSVVNLHRGTWHWGPYPLGAQRLRIFNVQGRGYANDNGIAWLARDHHVTYEVAINE